MNEKFDEHIKEEEHYGSIVKTNTYTDPIRREECMCLYCANLKPGSDNNCPIAQTMFEVSRKHDCAMMMTRCKSYVKGEYFDGRKNK